MELGRRKLGDKLKKLLYPISSTYPTGQLELCRLGARACIKKLLYSIPSTYPTGHMELCRLGARACIKKLLYTIPSTHPTGQMELCRLGARPCIKNYYIPYRLPIRQAKWSYAVMELGRVSNKLLYPIPSTYPTG